MMADLMFRKNEYDSATFHFQQLLERKPGKQPGQSFSLSLCGPISISRANAHMVHMGLESSTSHHTLFS